MSRFFDQNDQRVGVFMSPVFSLVIPAQAGLTIFWI